jgi:imidazole glycerol-phosphate synthase subunit HisH
MGHVALVDYGMANIDSVRRALEECGAEVHVTDRPEELRRADRIVLPGVGAFPDAMTNLRARGLDQALTDEVVRSGAPFLGICLGMQLIAGFGHEGTPTEGLGWIDAEVVRLQPADSERIPHVGWNEVDAGPSSRALQAVPPGADFYFVHSYHVVCEDGDDVAATTPYCGRFASVVEHDNIWAVQFHPEKSQRHGFTLLKNFLAA